jgi:radical SAM peptide maturase (CXXX-repeat target family)
MTCRKGFEQYQDYIGRILNAQTLFEDTPVITNMAKTVTFKVTDDCNLRCSYCYQINKCKSVMSFETAKKFIDLMFEESYREGSYLYIEDTPALVIEFIGGEPLLEIELIDKITDYFKYKAITLKHPWLTRYMISMISNGVNYFDENVHKYLDKNVGLVSFAVSLDGCQELHDMCRVFPDGRGSYALAEAACLDYMKNREKEMLTKMTIAPANITWTLKAFTNLVSLGYTTIHANVVYEEGWEPEHGTIFYEELKKISDFLLENDLENDIYTSLFDEESFARQSDLDTQNYCGSTGCMLACDTKGDIFTCIRFMESSLGTDADPYSIGNVDIGIGQAKCHKARIDELNSVTRQSQSKQECLDCPVGIGCGWCTAYNYQVTGSVNKRVTYICDMHKARSLANVYHWNRVYKKNNETDKCFKMHLPKEDALKYISEEEYEMLYNLQK